jgi:hypothetical protein
VAVENSPNGNEGLTETRSQTARDEFMRMVGALNLAEKLTTSIGSQTLHLLDRIKREKTYQHGNYKTFDDFLDHDPNSPMKADTFRRRWNLLAGEGNEAFDLLNSLRVPFEARKLLAGQMSVNGEDIKIGDAELKITDHNAIVHLIATLHGKAAETQRTNERLTKKIEKGEADFEKLKRKAIIANPSGTPTGQALLTAAGALSQLREALEIAPDEEKQALSEQIFEMLRVNQLEMSVALGVVSKSEVSSLKSQVSEITDEDAEAMAGD